MATTFRYNGDVLEVKAYGKTFRNGKDVEVTKKEHIEKLRGNPYFDEIDGKGNVVEKKVKKPEKPKKTGKKKDQETTETPKNPDETPNDNDIDEESSEIVSSDETVNVSDGEEGNKEE